uniref:Uncharacterized protein n=1 Tax=Coccolithus braarudii TaxID=221442 RepID=A0A7S0L4A1_9EUKA|mmetsp:Transcript_19470/g.41975  ORF Transcript_19470/g.41975 Transcript_19470/m.41975 type:complete len:108 (+) Transcript_19470:323-646(+)
MRTQNPSCSTSGQFTRVENSLRDDGQLCADAAALIVTRLIEDRSPLIRVPAYQGPSHLLLAHGWSFAWLNPKHIVCWWKWYICKSNLLDGWQATLENRKGNVIFGPT